MGRRPQLDSTSEQNTKRQGADMVLAWGRSAVVEGAKGIEGLLGQGNAYIREYGRASDPTIGVRKVTSRFMVVGALLGRWRPRGRSPCSLPATRTGISGACSGSSDTRLVSQSEPPPGGTRSCFGVVGDSDQTNSHETWGWLLGKRMRRSGEGEGRCEVVRIANRDRAVPATDRRCR